MRYPKECILKDCQEAVIRPLKREDEQSLCEFYGNISDKDRWFLRFDTAKPEVIKTWIEGIGEGTYESIVGTCAETIIAHGSLHMRKFGCIQQIGRLRIMVLPAYRNQRLGTWLLLDLIQLAMDKGLQELRVDLVAGREDAAIEAVKKFDFFKKATLKNYVKGPRGNRYDLVIMMKRLHKDWGDF